MRRALALLLFATSMTGSGCALIEDGARNSCLMTCSPVREHREMARNYRWADAAWSQIHAPAPGVAYTPDYIAGFKDGYAEYLFRGGDGEPPLSAPNRYRRLRYQTQEGHQAVQDWFHGYRHGATAARESGARQWITNPTSLNGPPRAPEGPLPLDLPRPTPLPDPTTIEPIPAPKKEVVPPLTTTSDPITIEVVPPMPPRNDAIPRWFAPKMPTETIDASNVPDNPPLFAPIETQPRPTDAPKAAPAPIDRPATRSMIAPAQHVAPQRPENHREITAPESSIRRAIAVRPVSLQDAPPEIPHSIPMILEFPMQPEPAALQPHDRRGVIR